MHVTAENETELRRLLDWLGERTPLTFARRSVKVYVNWGFSGRITYTVDVPRNVIRDQSTADLIAAIKSGAYSKDDDDSS